MLIETPTEIPSPWFEGTLELHDIENIEGRKGGKDSGSKPPLNEQALEASRPTLTIGKPQWWNIAAIYGQEGKPIPAVMTQSLKEADFYLVWLSCSFRTEKNTRIDRARLSVRMKSPKAGKPPPVAWDLHPQEVYDEAQHNVHIKVGASLKFAEAAEVSVGEIATDIKINEILPVVTTTGLLEDEFDWTMTPTERYPLGRGARSFYALLKVPHGLGGVEAALSVTADLVTPQGFWRAALREQEQNQLTGVICV